LVDRVSDFETAELLIEYGADINNGYFEPKHVTLSGTAISQKNTDMVIFLITHGADPDIRNAYGYNACDRARIYQLKEIEQLNAISRK